MQPTKRRERVTATRPKILKGRLFRRLGKFLKWMNQALGIEETKLTSRWYVFKNKELKSELEYVLPPWLINQRCSFLSSEREALLICGLNYCNTKFPSAAAKHKKASRERPSMGFKDSISGGSAFPLAAPVSKLRMQSVPAAAAQIPTLGPIGN